MAGLSMGGVHSCMTAALYPGPIATAALLAPRSAAVAYCDGALSAAMAWQPLLREVDEQNNPVLKVGATTLRRTAFPRWACTRWVRGGHAATDLGLSAASKRPRQGGAPPGAEAQEASML